MTNQHIKVLKIINRQRNANENCSEISLQSCQMAEIKQTDLRSIGEGVEQLAPTYIAGGSTDWLYPFENYLGVLTKAKYGYTHDPAIPHLGISKRHECICLQKDVYKNIRSNRTHKSPKLEASQISINRRKILIHCGRRE